MKYKQQTTLEQLEAFAKKNPKALVVWAVHTAWWCCWDVTPQGTYQNALGIPTDPRGSVLFQAHDLAGFLEKAKENADHYGKHGILAFMAAYHGNVTTDDGKPTSLESWQKYNVLIDAEKEEQ